jgi:lysozyme
MQYSKQGLALTEQFEGCRLTAYPDQVGVPTVGYGHTRGVRLGMTCTQEQAEAWLRDDIAICEQDVNTHVKVPLTQGEFDALVDFSFNLGCQSLNGSTLLRLLNAGDYHGAAAEFEKWSHAGGKVVAGLLRRRQAEVVEFNS